MHAVPEPYDVAPLIDGFGFTTTAGVQYFYYFNANAESQLAIPELSGHVFSFGFFLLNADDFLSLPTDERVAATLVQAIGEKFVDHRTIIVFIVEHDDNRHPARIRKFNRWYEQYGSPEIKLYSGVIIGDLTPIYSAMLMHEANPFKELALQRYRILLDRFSK